MAKTAIYRVWNNMRNRCLNPHNRGFWKYGARGVTVAERWASFENFLADMGERPSPKHSIDRIDNSRGYEPGNCRWLDMRGQQNNRTNNRRVTYLGETFTLAEWAQRTGLSNSTLQNRLDLLGWPIERALTTPARGRKRAA
jgi:hypothetical protein